MFTKKFKITVGVIIVAAIVAVLFFNQFSLQNQINKIKMTPPQRIIETVVPTASVSATPIREPSYRVQQSVSVSPEVSISKK